MLTLVTQLSVNVIRFTYLTIVLKDGRRYNQIIWFD